MIDLEDCSSQRNLNDVGRQQARELGRAFRALEIPVGEVRSSEYCRTRETAELAFGRAALEPDLTGFPNDDAPEYAARVRRTKELLATPPDAGENTVLVAHIKNIEASAGISIEEGELAVFEPLGGTGYRYRGQVPGGSLASARGGSSDPAGSAAVLDQVLLVVLLGRPEGRGRDDLGRDRLARSADCARAFDSAAISACSGEWVKIAERYCVPTSQPWRFFCVGSCSFQNVSTSSAYEISLGSNVTSTASAWPVVPLQTSL